MAKSVADVACEPLDAEIARLQREIDGLERAKEIVKGNAMAVGTEAAGVAPKARKPRGPNKRKPGLPASETAAVS